MKKIGMFILIFASISVVSSAQQVTVSLEVEGIDNYEGKLLINVFDSEEDYLKKALKSLTVDLATEKTNSFVFADLSIGEYAISVVHDKNANGKLDFGAMGPVEEYGFSNNPFAMFGPADYSKAKMMVNADIATKIKIK